MPHRTEIPVTWADTDAGGLIYYPQYFHYVIVGLNDYFAPAFDGSHPMESLRSEGLILPAVEAGASFEAPLRAGETAVIETAVGDLGETSLTVDFAVERGDGGERAGSGSVSFVLVDGNFETVALPAAMRACVRERGDGDAS